jgi:hypothetical protein
MVENPKFEARSPKEIRNPKNLTEGNEAIEGGLDLTRERRWENAYRSAEGNEADEH